MIQVSTAFSAANTLLMQIYCSRLMVPHCSFIMSIQTNRLAILSKFGEG